VKSSVFRLLLFAPALLELEVAGATFLFSLQRASTHK